MEPVFFVQLVVQIFNVGSGIVSVRKKDVIVARCTNDRFKKVAKILERCLFSPRCHGNGGTRVVDDEHRAIGGGHGCSLLLYKRDLYFCRSRINRCSSRNRCRKRHMYKTKSNRTWDHMRGHPFPSFACDHMLHNQRNYKQPHHSNHMTYLYIT